MHVLKKKVYTLTILTVFLALTLINQAYCRNITVPKRPVYFPSKNNSYITFNTNLLPATFTTLYRDTSTRWHFNATWITTTTDLTINAFHSSGWLNYTVSASGTQEINYATKPKTVYIDGTITGEDSGWTYSGNTATVTTATSSVKLYFTDTEATGTSDGTVTVGNSVPTIINLDICVSSGASSVNDTAIDPQTTYISNFTITDANTIADIKNVTWVIFEETAADWDSVDANVNHYTFKWDQDTNVFSETGPSGSDEHLVSGSCSSPSDNSSNTGVVQLGFKLNDIAKYNATTTSWEINVTMFDVAASDTETQLFFGVNFYSELTISDSTHGWTGLTAGQTNQTMNDPDGDLDIVVTANANFNVQAQGNHTHLVVYSDNSKNITIGHVLIHETAIGSATNLTVTYANIVGLTNEASGANQAKAMILWINVPATQATGSYIYQLELKIVRYTA